jgi:hypothetical protein
MTKSIHIAALTLLLFAAAAAVSQNAVAPPPRPANDAPANAEVLKLLRAAMPESVVLNKIHAATGKFDTSVDALVALKQAGASDAELGAVLAQGAAPAGPSPAVAPTTSGPSLAESMQFIQDKLNCLGNVAFAQFLQNTSNGGTGTKSLTNEISNVVADPNQCSISYHRKATSNGSTYKDENSVFSLRDVQDIVVTPDEPYETKWQVKSGYPNVIVTSTSPPITALVARHAHGEESFFLFTDADLADRVAKAMVHAVELCGGGS